MKKCDSVGLTNDEYEEAVNLMKEGDSSVDFFKPIEYYKVGRDVTNEVWKIIESVKSEYSHLAGKNLLALWDFYKLVRNGAPLDLKNRSQFKTNSTFIFEGRIVDADYLGNFAYGYVGKYFGIDEGTLFPFGGYAQVSSRTSSVEFILTYNDDPKDQYAILEGILKYEKRIQKPSKLYSVIMYSISIYFLIPAVVTFIDIFIINLNLYIIIKSSPIVREIIHFNTAAIIYFPFIIFLGFGVYFYRQTVKSGGRKIFGIVPLLITLIILAVKGCLLLLGYCLSNLSI